MVKRVILSGLTIPDVTSADWDNPLAVGIVTTKYGDLDDELESNGTDIAEIPSHSRITRFKLNFMILGATSTTNVYRWMLLKRPDGESLLANSAAMIGDAFNSAADTPSQREWRKFLLAKGMVITNPNTAVSRLNIFVKKSALDRIAPMRENDAITLIIAKDTAGTTSLLHGFGNVYVKANA